METTEKTTETEARSTLARVYACTVAGDRFPAKFGCQPIKLQLYQHAHTYPANYGGEGGGMGGVGDGVGWAEWYTNLIVLL